MYRSDFEESPDGYHFCDLLFGDALDMFIKNLTGGKNTVLPQKRGGSLDGRLFFVSALSVHLNK